jgi:lipopolysaccharide export system permease protein
MKVLRNYILQELGTSFLMALFVFTIIMLVGNLVQLAEMVINKGVDIFLVAQLFLLFFPFILGYTIPMSILTAILLVFGRLSADNEITAMRSSGINMYRLSVPIIVLGLILSLGLVLLNDRVLPKTNFITRKIIKSIGYKKPAACLEAGTFIKDFKNYIIFIYDIEDNKLYNIRIYQPQTGKPTRTIIANSGEFITIPEKKIVKLKLMNGSSDEPNPNNPNSFYKLNFKTYYLNLNTEGQGEGLEKKPRDMTIKELKDEIKFLQNAGIDAGPLRYAIHQKIAMSFASLVFVFIGLPLAIKARRSEKSIGFALSLLIIMFYYLVSALGEAVAVKKTIPVWLCAWMANIIVLFVSAILSYRTFEKS